MPESVKVNDTSDKEMFRHKYTRCESAVQIPMIVYGQRLRGRVEPTRPNRCLPKRTQAIDPRTLSLPGSGVGCGRRHCVGTLS